jgi:hypothetical protein
VAYNYRTAQSGSVLPLSHKTSEITTTENKIFIKFQRTKDDYLYDFKIEKAFADDNGTISRRFVFFWYDSDSITYRITNQNKGDIIFNVVKNEILFSSKNASVCSYLIHEVKDHKSEYRFLDPIQNG